MNVSEVAALVEKTMYPVVIDNYIREPAMYPRLCKVTPINSSSGFGTKGKVIAGMGQLRIRSDAEAPMADRMFQAATWQAAYRIMGATTILEKRLLDSSDAMGKVGSLLSSLAVQWGKSAVYAKDAYLAKFFQKGTLTAGHEIFDQSYEGEQMSSSTRLFVYDGLPWFDGAHTIAGATTTYSNIATGTTLSAANLETMLGVMTMTNAVNERGEQISIRPNVLVVPPGVQEFTAKRIVNSAQTAGSANNDINAIQGMLEVIPWSLIADDTDCGYIGVKGEGIEVFDSGAPDIVIEPMNDGTGNLRVTPTCYFGVGITDAFRYWYSYGRADA